VHDVRKWDFIGAIRSVAVASDYILGTLFHNLFAKCGLGVEKSVNKEHHGDSN
jgi:hypothetical protein